MLLPKLDAVPGTDIGGSTLSLLYCRTNLIGELHASYSHDSYFGYCISHGFPSLPPLQFVGFDSPKIEKESASIRLFHLFKLEGTPSKVVV